MRRWAERGFTLLEVLIAFIIAAIALGVLVDGAVTGMRSASLAAATEQAVSRAKSRIAATSLAPVAGEQEGDDGGGYHWRTLTRLVGRIRSGVPQQPGGGAGAIGLYEITVWISWTADGRTREVRLTTERTAPAPSG